ncbi:hypothetical protein QTI66_23755 [Variovorax sp. J22R133]|uniref:hypothetical protein n=1 Tax=Variovorax brevis TaxID=3053503 RepID=UPI002576083E|nr:hypothetical protein [Variovorax sp. J22R133]MDM0115186.1 hypothetical protein [Variovorax sp. J22R133]
MKDARHLPLFVFSDLDDTLFCSVRKRALTADSQPAALLKNGDVISYSNDRQRAFLNWLMRDARLVPVTARSVEAYRRVLMSFPGPAIVSFGGVLLDADGREDAQWAAHMAQVLAPAEPQLEDACTVLQRGIEARGLNAWARVVREGGLAQYVVAKHRDHDVHALTQLKVEVLQPWLAAHPGYRAHQNDNNLALLPPGLDKAQALEFLLARLRQEHGAIVTVGFGDSYSDADFMALCDYGLTPGGTQLGHRLAGRGGIGHAG